MEKPTLVIIQGLSATGKTTFGKQIAAKLGLPFLCRDKFKEQLFDDLTYEGAGVEWSRKIGAATFKLMYHLIERFLEAGASCVAETCWFPEFAEPELKRLLSAYPVKCVQIFFECNEETRRKRFVDRSVTTRHPVHKDAERTQLNSPRKVENVPLNLNYPVVRVDTTDFDKVDVDEIVRQVMSHLHQSPTS